MTDDLHAEALATFDTDHRHLIASSCPDHLSFQSRTVVPTMPLALLPNRATVDGPRFFDTIYLVLEMSYSGTAKCHPSAHSPPPDHN